MGVKFLPTHADRLKEPLAAFEYMESLKVLRAPSPQAERHTRRDARVSATLPLRLTTGSGEMIPAVILNVSVSGLLALVDERASLLLPPPRGARFDGEFFFENIEISHVTLEIVRVDRRGVNQLALGCKFIDLSPTIGSALRTKVVTRLQAKPQSSR